MADTAGDKLGSLHWALTYAHTYWQHGNEPQSQLAFAVLSQRLHAVESKVASWRAAIATVGTSDQDAELVVEDFAALVESPGSTPLDAVGDRQ